MINEIKKSTSPLFIAYSADPNDPEPRSTVMTKKQAIDYAAYENERAANSFESGEIICEVVPLGFYYKNDDGEVVCGDVKQEDLINMLCLQADIEEGIAEHVITKKYADNVAKHKEMRKECEMQMAGARYFAGDDGTLDKYGVENALISCKGYSHASLLWRGDVCIVDLGYDGYAVSPCGRYHGICVYDPYDVDCIPDAQDEYY